jgi:hypothetical protein
MRHAGADWEAVGEPGVNKWIDPHPIANANPGRMEPLDAGVFGASPEKDDRTSVQDACGWPFRLCSLGFQSPE